MIIQIALGILLGFLLIALLPLLIQIGVWLLYAVVVLIIAFLLLRKVDDIHSYLDGFVINPFLLFQTALIVVLTFLGLVALGWLSYCSQKIVNLLKLGNKPMLDAKQGYVIGYRELMFDYLTAGIKLSLVFIAIATVILFAVVPFL